MGWHRGYWGGWHINHRGGFWVLVCLGWFWGLATAGVALAQEEVLGALEQALENFVAENFEAAESAERQAEQKALIERALIATDGATGWETPQRRRASKILLNLGTQALADGFYSHSERLLLRAQSLIPVGNAGLRQDAKTRAGLFTAFGKLYLARQDWAQAEFWLAQAEDQIKEAGFADEVASNVYAYEVAFWQGRVLLGRAQEAEAEVARDLAGQAVAKLRALYQDTEEKLRQESLDSVVNHLRLLQIRNALAEASAVLGRLQEQAGEDSAKALAEAQSLWNATLREATEKEQVPPALQAAALEGLAEMALTRGQLRDALAATDLALSLREQETRAWQARVHTLALRGRVRLESRAFAGAAQDFTHAERLLLHHKHGATLASLELALASATSQQTLDATQARQAAAHVIATGLALLPNLDTGGGDGTNIQASPSLLRTPLTAKERGQVRLVVLQGRVLLAEALIKQGLAELARTELEEAWRLGEDDSACGRARQAVMAGRETALLLAEMGDNHLARRQAVATRALLVCHQGADSAEVKELEKHLVKFLR